MKPRFLAMLLASKPALSEKDVQASLYPRVRVGIDPPPKKAA